MEHLSLETLARLVDGAAAPDEAEHLERCPACRKELEALRDQSVGLSHLPDLRPPGEEWTQLEGRLRSEGLIRPERPGRRSRGRRSVVAAGPMWMQAAAVLALLVAGTGVGYGVANLSRAPGGGPEGVVTAPAGPGTDDASLASLDRNLLERDLSLEEAEELVRLTEEWYLAALVRFRERLEIEDAPSGQGPNPLTRVAALETLMAASRAAVREAPTDPFLNGVLVNMRAERDATLRGIQASAPGASWY